MIRTVTFTANGREFSLRYPSSPLMEHVIQETLRGEYPFLPFLKDEPGIILDVDANIGCAALLFHALYPHTAVFAFEPSRETFNFLQSNTAAFSGVHLFSFGLFDRDGSAKLYDGGAASVTNSVGHSALNYAEYEEVSLRRISSFLDEQVSGESPS